MTDKIKFDCEHEPNEGVCAHCFVQAHEIIEHFLKAFREYEMNVDTSPPHKHKLLMERAVSFTTPNTRIRKHT